MPSEMNTNIEAIRELAGRFRKGIENCDSTRMIITMGSFPHGACGDAALLLARYLRDNGAGEFQYVVADRGEGEDWTSHAWLEQDGLVVDITADQFDELEAPVLVTEDRSFHDTFGNLDRGQSADFEVYTLMVSPGLGDTYRAILEAIGR
jgi:hypothetical protein